MPNSIEPYGFKGGFAFPIPRVVSPSACRWKILIDFERSNQVMFHPETMTWPPFFSKRRGLKISSTYWQYQIARHLIQIRFVNPLISLANASPPGVKFRQIYHPPFGNLSTQWSSVAILQGSSLNQEVRKDQWQETHETLTSPSSTALMLWM